MRDDFSKKTIRTLSARVGYHCSNPTCLASTSGPALDEQRTISIGVAAHIAAAAAGGKRYDSNMTPAERSSAANGIWLCQSCSKLIDSDEQRYTVPLLHQWKKDAVQRALDAVAGGHPLGPIKPPSTLDAADEAFLHGLDLPSTDAVDVVEARLRAATRTDVQSFRAARGGPARTIALTLRLECASTPDLTIESVARLTALAEALALVAPGGTGKSTTLMQVAESMDAQDGLIPVLIPLGEWSDRQEDFFDSVLRRSAFGTFRRQHLMQLAFHGRLALLLDGWNELSPEARLRATNDLKALQRDYPQLGFVISSRRQVLPIARPLIIIETLSQDQQMELAEAIRGPEGVELVDRAWRTEGVRDLVGNPLYLNALLTLPPGGVFPETKEAVLRMFVQYSESAPDKVERLQRDTLGQHTLVLIGLAVGANRNATTVISDSNANRAVSAMMRRLSDDGQIGSAPQPRAVIDGLVSAHLLVRSPGADGAVSFQHQLFQEWYAAAEVERLMLGAGGGDADARKSLREEILNWPSWEESILFACDRLSRAGADGTNAVASAIEETLGIDPLLAAAMLDRAADQVWECIRHRVLSFIGRWHKRGTFDRAVRFMVASGKPEFAEMIWTLASSEDDQTQFKVFRAADRFRPNVLGPDREARLRALPTPQRKLALSEIASNSGFDGMELATTLASIDPDPEVVVAVVQSLAFRRGDRHVSRIMKAASGVTWKTLGRESYPHHLADAQLDARLAAERQAARSAATHPVCLLGRIADEKAADAEARISRLIGTAEIDTKDLHFEHAIAEAYPKYPGAIAAGLVARIAADLPLPFRAVDYLMDAPLLDTGPVAQAALDPSTPERRLNAAAAVIGPVTVAALFDRLIGVDDQIHALDGYDEELSNARARLVNALAETRQSVFVSVLLEKASTEDTSTEDPRRIGLLADVVARHGGKHGSGEPPIDTAHRGVLSTVVKRWMETLLKAPQPARHAASQVARAVERLADPDLAAPLRRLLERDLVDYATARARRLAAGSRGSHDDMGYILMYTGALAAMHDAPAIEILTEGLGDLRWGVQAASALYDIWSAGHLPKENRNVGWTNYSQHLSWRAERAAGAPLTSESAEAIFAVVRALGDALKSDAEQQHALALGVVGLALPHGAKRREIDALLALPQPIARKRPFLSAAARAGEIIPAALLMDGLRDLLEAAKAQSWRLGENGGELMGWIDLFPFSDNPELVYDALALLPKQHQRPHALRRLLETIPQGPGGAALDMLQRLAADYPAFLQESEWLNALVKLNTEAAAFATLEHLCAGHIPAGNHFRLSNALTEWSRKHTKVREAMIARYRGLPVGGIRRVLEIAMKDLTGEDVFMALFDAFIDSPNAIQGVAGAIRNLAIGSKPSGEWAGAFEEFGMPLTALRARLFGMLPANDPRARLAKECLVTIEECRDERGRINNEPRHPDIDSGRAWPPEWENKAKGIDDIGRTPRD